MVERALRGFLRPSLPFVGAAALLSACHGGGGGSAPPPATYTVGGAVTGLAGTGLLLRNNGGNDLALAGNGGFAFATALTAGAAFTVTVQTQPTNPTQTCTVANGTGAVAAANVTNVTVTCVTNTYNVGGTISNLAGGGLVLQNNGAGNLPLAAGSTSFTFATKVPSGGAYSVTVLTQPAGPSQTCTTANASGTVVAADVSNVALTCVTGKFQVGGNVHGLLGAGLVLRNNGADALPINADGPFTFPLLIDSGAPYNVLASAHPLNPAQECSPTRNSGTVGASAVTDVSIDCYAMGKFLFATNSLAANVTGAAIDQSTGVLSAVPGAPFAVGAGPVGATATPDGKFLYVSNLDARTINGYAINATTGALAAVPGSPFAAGMFVDPATIAPNGKFLYATDQQNARFFAFAINATTGELTPIGAPVATTDRTIAARVDPTSRFLYVLTRAVPSDAISLVTYSIDASTGAPTPVGTPLAVGATMPPGGKLAIAANGAALFVSSAPPNQVHAYTLNATTGAPTVMPGSPFASSGPPYVVPHPKLAVLYVGQANSLAAYAVGATLTPLPGSPNAATGAVTAILFDPGARFLYAAGSGGVIAAFTIGSDGRLDPLIGGGVTLPFAATALLADPGGRYLFAVDFFTSNVQPVAVNTTTGRLSLVVGNVFGGGVGTNNLAVVK